MFFSWLFFVILVLGDIMNAQELEKLYNLLDVFDKSIYVKNVKEAQEDIFNDTLLMDFIRKYYHNDDKSLENDILHNPKVVRLKQEETCLNLLIWEINQHFETLKEV